MNQKQYTITINGVSESISQIDALLAKLNEIENRLKNINTSSLNTSSAKQTSSATGTEVKQQEEVAQATRTTAEENQRNLEALAGINRQLAENTNLQKEAMEIADRILGSNQQLHEVNEQYKKDLETIKLDRKEIDTLEKYGQVSAEEAMQRRTALAQKEMEIKTARQQNLVILRNEQKLLSSEEGSYQEISYTLSRLKEALKSVNAGNLSPEDLQKLAGAIDETDKKAKAMAASMGEFQRNVGNYGSAFAGIEGLKIKIGETEAEFSNAREAIRALRNAMTELALEGKTDTEQFRQYEDALKGIQMASIKVSDSIDRAKDASTGLHDAIEMFEGVTAIASIGQGLSNIFGIEDSEIQEKINKMTSLIGVMQGLQNLSTQMATGTGIGPALKKLFDTAGSNPVEMFKNMRDGLKGIKNETDSATGGLLNMGKAAGSVKSLGAGLWKGLVAGGTAMLAIGLFNEATDAIKSLYDAAKDLFGIGAEADRREVLANAIDNETSALERNLKVREQINELNDASEVEKAKDRVELESEALKNQLEIIKSLYKTKADMYVNDSKKRNVAEYYGDAFSPVQGMPTDEGERYIEQLDNTISKYKELAAAGKDTSSDIKKASEDMVTAFITQLVKMANNIDENGVEKMQALIANTHNLSFAMSEAGASSKDLEQVTERLKSIMDFIARVQEGFFNLKRTMKDTSSSLAKDIENWSIEGIADSTERALKKAEQAYNDDIKSIRERAKNADEERKAIEARDAAYEQQVKTIMESNRKIGASASSTRKPRVSEAERTARELAQIEKQIQLDKINAMRDGLTKTLELIKREREERLKALEKYKGNAKYEGLVNDTNAIFDDREQKARLEFVKEYTKSMRELKAITDSLGHELNETITSFREVSDANEVYEREAAAAAEFIDKALQNQTENYKKYSKLLDKVSEQQMKIAALEKSGKEPELVKGLKAEFVRDANELLELSKQLADTEVVSDNQKKSLDLWSEYNRKRFSMQQDADKEATLLERQALTERFDYELKVLKERKKEELEAVDERYKNLLNDTEGLKEIGKTQEEIVNEVANEKQKIYEHYNSLIALNEKALIAEIIKIDNEYQQDRISNTENFYDNLIGENDKYANYIMNKASELERNNTNSWGIINLPKLKKQRKEAENEIQQMVKAYKGIQVAMRAMAQAGMISPDAFKKFNDEIDNMIGKLHEAEEELKKTDPIGYFISSINTYIQEVGSAISSLMSSIYDYQESLLDAEEDALDKQNDILDKKLTEQEEITRRHKEAIDDIENELKTARGDRRDALIDQLNAEVAAQRASLAAEKRIKAQQEALQKKQDALDLRRKNMQKEQSKTQAIISAALATANGYATEPFIPVGLAMGSLAAALGAAQVALISAQKFANGGEINGPSHAQGGVPVEVEGGEFVVNKRAYSSNEELVRLINSAGRRLTIADLQTVGYDAPGAIETRFNEPIVVSSQEPVYVSVVDINNAQNRLVKVKEMAS